MLTSWHEQSKLYHESFQYKDLHPYPPETANEATYYYANIRCINQEVASVHCFVTTVGHSKVEQQIAMLGSDLDVEDIDLLVDSGCKSLSQLLADENIALQDISPTFIPQDIPVTPAPSTLLLPALPVPLLLAAASTLPHSSNKSSPVLACPAPSATHAPSSSPLSYIYDPPIAQPQPLR